MMTRKDYKFTAATLNEVIDFMHPAAFAQVVDSFVLYMADDNPNFDEQRFIDACYAERELA